MSDVLAILPLTAVLAAGVAVNLWWRSLPQDRKLRIASENEHIPGDW